jgi:hypothetical protein
MAQGDTSIDGDGDRPGVALVRRICESCVQSLHVTGAAISVMTAGGHRGVLFATDDIARSLEDVTFTLGEGPGTAAFETGRAVLVPDLDDPGGQLTGKWPAFAGRAGELGVRAVFAFPVQLGAASLGALTAYRLKPGILDGDDLATAVRLADQAAVAVLDIIVGVGDHGSSDPSDPTAAEFYRSEVYQAAGMITVQLGVTIEVAMMRLRSHAFVTDRSIADVARDIVRRVLRLEADNE